MHFAGENGNLTVEDYFNPKMVILNSDGTKSGISSCSKTCTISNCGEVCGAAIKANNWKIPENYPW